jgi:DTW domain-containing protein YfiP
MNLTDYHQKRSAEREALKGEEALHRVSCSQCHRSAKACFCSKITPFSTNFEFRLLMHPKEAKKEKVGTGRLTNIALNNCEIIIDEKFDDNKEVQIIDSDTYFPILLYPGEESFNISSTDFASDPFKGKKPLLFIIDGTWPCAKSMMRDSKSLHFLPRISFNADVESIFSIKHQPAKYCLSTIESIYQVLIALERQGLESLEGKAEHLLEVLQLVVDFQFKCANDPNIQSYRSHQQIYKKPSERRVSSKWDSRKICFEERNFK